MAASSDSRAQEGVGEPHREAVFAATENDVSSARGRLLVQVEGRYIALVLHGDEIFAIDATCYHMGGPLTHADIEDLGSFGPAIVCPWHRYQISLRTGDGLYVNMARETCSKGPRQRTHAVERRDGQVFVRVSGAESKLDSDTYAFKPPAPSGGARNQPPPGRSGGALLQPGAAGVRGGPAPCARGALGAGPSAPAPSTVASDVLRSMSGADGRAPWARGPRGDSRALPAAAPRASALSPQAGLGRALGLSGLVPWRASRPAQPLGSEWEARLVLATRTLGGATVELSVEGPLPGEAAAWTRGSHLMLRLPGGGAEGAERPFTPIALRGQARHFALVVKAYAHGLFSTQLASLQPGAQLLMRGPLGGSRGVLARTTDLGLVAGGTGITPLLQLLHDVVSRRAASPLPRVSLCSFNRTADDVLLRAELEELAAANDAIRVAHCLTDPPPGWQGLTGRPSARVLASPTIPRPGPHVQIFYCGPPAFNDSVRAALSELGYTDEMVHEFS